MDLDLRHDEEASRYELRDSGSTVAFIEYRVEGDHGERLVMHHTYVEPARRREGLAAMLVERALDDVRSSGRVVVPTCWYVAEFMDARPEYAEIRRTAGARSAPSLPRDAAVE